MTPPPPSNLLMLWQDGGLDTVDANRRLGFKDDHRSYECVDYILRDMGVKVSVSPPTVVLVSSMSTGTVDGKYCTRKEGL